MKKEYKLRANWSKKENDLVLDYPLGQRTKSDAHYLSLIFNDKFLQEMKDRGYDVTKMKFEIPIKIGSRLGKFETLNKRIKNE